MRAIHSRTGILYPWSESLIVSIRFSITYKQLNVTLQCLIIFYFLCRNLHLKLNKKQTDPFQIKIGSKIKNIIDFFFNFL